MDNLITRLQLRSTIQEYISQLMTQNGITASQMEDALNYVMLLIKDAVLSDYAIYTEQFYNQDKMNAMQNLVQSYAEEGKEPQIVNGQYVGNTSTPVDAEAQEEE